MTDHEKISLDVEMTAPGEENGPSKEPLTNVIAEEPPTGDEGEQTSSFCTQLKNQSAKDLILGDYDYAYVCTPVLNPWSPQAPRDVPFYGPNDKLPLLLALLMGFQHSLAMVGGIITPPLLVGSMDQSEGKVYQKAMVSSALIVSGFASLLQVIRVKLPLPKGRAFFIGSGLLSVMGTSFTFLPIAQGAVKAQTNDPNDPVDFPTAYGSLLGVFALGSCVEFGASFVPTRILRAIFPPYITGVTVFLIGASLIGTGVRQWGGGEYCAQNPGEGCIDVGDSHLTYGHPVYFGLGFLVVTITMFLELWGSPFLRSCQVAMGLLLGYLVAACTTDPTGASYVDLQEIKEAPVITFLWTTTFPIGFYAPALLPCLIGFMVSAVESLGDLTASGEASGLDPNSPEQAQAIQGGLRADGVAILFSALAFGMPQTTFSQNSGVIVMTRVASRLAGGACGLMLILYGVFGQVGAFFTSIPMPVLGGMTTFLTANIALSGMRVITSYPTTRRVRFLVASALAFGLGVTIFPAWTANLLDCEPIESSFLQGICLGAELTYSTGYALGCLVALVLHAILPRDIIQTVNDDGDDLGASKKDQFELTDSVVDLDDFGRVGSSFTLQYNERNGKWRVMSAPGHVMEEARHKPKPNTGIPLLYVNTLTPGAPDGTTDEHFIHPPLP
mmetsp:Transcript_34845/g.98797  ORF Transcript_34845/g.98797 Transcript_34845/m.98797 type:complete len:671 (-) Transcript_34845:52-2064(-)